MNELLALGKTISRARKLANLSQKELGNKISVSNKTISAYESGRAVPPLHSLQKIAEITNQPIDIFFQSSEKTDTNILNLKLDIILEEIDKIKKKLKIL